MSSHNFRSRLSRLEGVNVLPAGYGEGLVIPPPMSEEEWQKEVLAHHVYIFELERKMLSSLRLRVQPSHEIEN